MASFPADPLFGLADRVAVITGGAGLLGLEHAKALAGRGARIVLTDLNVDVCRERARHITEDIGSECIALACDVTSQDSWNTLVEHVVSRFGRLDILVNNAAYTNQSKTGGFAAPFDEFPVDDWNALLGVNLTGSFLGCQVVGRQMMASGRGSIINIASLYGVVSPNHRMYPDTGIHQPVAYSVSKAGVIALTRYVATLWADRGVRVNCITPGGVFNDHPKRFTDRYNELSPRGRMARPDEMQGAVVYLASDASSYCTGHNLVVDGGWTIW